MTLVEPDGTHYEHTLIELPDFQYVGSVWWDENGFFDTAVWRKSSAEDVWYYQDRDHGKPYPKLVETDRNGLLLHLAAQRCSAPGRGVLLVDRIKALK